MNSSGSVTAVNVFGADGLLARTGASNIYYTFDEQGNVAQRLNSSQSVTSSSTYDAYGAETSTGSPSDPFGYNAKWCYYFDREAGVYKCTFRDYDPRTGRWLIRDPIDYNGGMNVYAHAICEPVALHDPSGLSSWLDFKHPSISFQLAELIANCSAEILLLQSGLVSSTRACEDCMEDAAGALGAIAGAKLGTSYGNAIGGGLGALGGGAAGSLLDPGPGTAGGMRMGATIGRVVGSFGGLWLGPALGRKLAETAIRPYLKAICDYLSNPCVELPTNTGHIVEDDPHANIA
jgi:RHS repeat-associated protein